MANLLIPWQRYLSDVAHKYVGYPDEEGGDMFPIIEITDDETGALSVTAGELAEMLENSPVIVITHSATIEDKLINTLWEFIVSYIIDDGAYTFSCFSAATGLGGTDGYYETRIASSADDYPVLD